ncbi:MBL fold metallo-hydrolase [Streptomyces griseorubiginosus]|uniref:MBL fold metallo-hydrolase n=1 Tax=Streptomyces griseorubiginosus TaxID=67304 RepID=UPI001AD6AA28|nr:MBL fold metallo-hydrolase [Streptomyces griseorubiginosus]MBO4259549.1 MBL fold metallo-hydrolase [Streptomyces griseorubiginosus]
MPKPFASTGDTRVKQQTLQVIAHGAYAVTAEGDPNFGAVEGEDFIVCFEALATPTVARRALAKVRQHTDKPVRYLVLSHYHAARALGASAFGADVIIAHAQTRALIEERGRQDWESEQGRFPALFEDPGSIPGLTWPDVAFADELSIDLGGERGELRLFFLGRGHTSGDIVAWLPRHKVLYAGDLVETQAALYTGDAYHREWATGTLDRIASLGAEVLVGGRGVIAQGKDEVDAAIGQTRGFLTTLIDAVQGVHERGGGLKDAFEAAHGALEPGYGGWPIFQHCLPFDVARLWEELSGQEHPTIWTPERDRQVWAQLQD